MCLPSWKLEWGTWQLGGCDKERCRCQAQICKWVLNDKLFCKTAVSKKICKGSRLHVLQNMSSGNGLLSAFRFLSHPIKIINVIINKQKISKNKDENMP